MVDTTGVETSAKGDVLLGFEYAVFGFDFTAWNQANTATHPMLNLAALLTWTLGANLENLILTGTAAINGTGNALNNVLTGNGANNLLTALACNVSLNGGAGNDSLNG